MSRLAIPHDSPLFAGHFPGRPILPGVALLSLIRPAEISAIPFARFRGLVAPGDALEIDFRQRGDDGKRFDVRRGQELVANGALLFGAPPTGPRWRAPVRDSRSIPCRALIPHQPPMLFAEQIVAADAEGAISTGRIPAECPLAAEGRVPAHVGLELAAQTAGCWEALRRSEGTGDGGPRVGYLVSLEDVRLHRPSLPVEAPLTASIRMSACAPPLTHYAVEVACDGVLALSGTIGTYLSEPS